MMMVPVMSHATSKDLDMRPHLAADDPANVTLVNSVLLSQHSLIHTISVPVANLMNISLAQSSLSVTFSATASTGKQLVTRVFSRSSYPKVIGINTGRGVAQDGIVENPHAGRNLSDINLIRNYMCPIGFSTQLEFSMSRMLFGVLPQAALWPSRISRVMIKKRIV
jgi:hypothetical protein